MAKIEGSSYLAMSPRRQEKFLTAWKPSTAFQLWKELSSLIVALFLLMGMIIYDTSSPPSLMLNSIEKPWKNTCAQSADCRLLMNRRLLYTSIPGGLPPPKYHGYTKSLPGARLLEDEASSEPLKGPEATTLGTSSFEEAVHPVPSGPDPIHNSGGSGDRN